MHLMVWARSKHSSCHSSPRWPSPDSRIHHVMRSHWTTSDVWPTSFSLELLFIELVIHWVHHFMGWWWWNTTPTPSTFRMHDMTIELLFSMFTIKIVSYKLMIHWSMCMVRGSCWSLRHETRVTTWGTPSARWELGSHASCWRHAFPGRFPVFCILY